MRLVHALPHALARGALAGARDAGQRPMPQSRPQTPQLRRSVAGSMQVPLHAQPQRSCTTRPCAQTPATHARPDMHALPQRLQWVELVASATSQPLASVASQSPKPAAQVMPQTPIAQVGVVLGRVWRAIPQSPQWATLVAVWTSRSSCPPSRRSRRSPCASRHAARRRTSGRCWGAPCGRCRARLAVRDRVGGGVDLAAVGGVAVAVRGAGQAHAAPDGARLASGARSPATPRSAAGRPACRRRARRSGHDPPGSRRRHPRRRPTHPCHLLLPPRRRVAVVRVVRRVEHVGVPVLATSASTSATASSSTSTSSPASGSSFTAASTSSPSSPTAGNRNRAPRLLASTIAPHRNLRSVTPIPRSTHGATSMTSTPRPTVLPCGIHRGCERRAVGVAQTRRSVFGAQLAALAVQVVTPCTPDWHVCGAVRAPPHSP